jgi:GTP1/Obg family GTP-binding protein
VPGFAGGKWAEPSKADLQKFLRQLSKSAKEGKKKAKVAKATVLESFTCSTITSKMRDRLDEIVSKLKNKQ